MTEGTGQGLEIPRRLGDYELVRQLGREGDVLRFEALQLSVRRPVALELLDPAKAADPETKHRFRSEIRAKAAATHAHLFAVYEAHEESGWIFYTREMIRGEDLAQLQALGATLPLSTVWKLIQSVCEALIYLEDHQVSYQPLRDSDVLLVHQETYLTNVASARPTPPDAFRRSVRILAHHLPAFLDDSEARLPVVVDFFARMDPGHPHAFRTWKELLAATMRVQQETVTSFQRIDPDLPHRTRASLEKVATRSRSPLPAVVLWCGAVLALAAVVLAVVLSKGPEIRPLGNMLYVPGGEFLYQDGQNQRLGAFWIDEHEVTIAKYQTFLDALGAGDTAVYDHPDQPPGKRGHVPPDWHNLHEEARRGGSYEGMPVDPNCPAVNVDWWDAYAYAKWKGGRLPTEQEWEKAARGAAGWRFPWGNEEDAARLNSGSDFDSQKGRGGHTDGFNGWCAVDALPQDRSPFGVMGMAGNVSEWTSSWTNHPDFPDRSVPVVRGASFMTRGNLDLTVRRAREPGSRALSVGFRVVRDSPPPAE